MPAIAPLVIPDILRREAARLRAHPRFAAAVRVTAEDMLGFYDGQPLLNRMMSEEGRWLIGGFTLFLHFTRDVDDPTSGATLARIQALAASHQVASPGRVAALIALMRWGGHLVQVTAPTDRRVRRLEPTESMLAYTRPWMAAHLEPLRMLDPDCDFRDIAHEPDFIAGFYREAGTRFLAGVRVLEDTPAMRLFMGRDAGYMILLRLWLSDPDGAVPPRRPVPLPSEKVAREFGVSRAHVRKLMDQAAAAGFVKLHAEGGRAVEVLPPLVELFDSCLALQLANIAHCVRHAAGRDRVPVSAGSDSSGSHA